MRRKAAGCYPEVESRAPQPVGEGEISEGRLPWMMDGKPCESVKERTKRGQTDKARKRGTRIDREGGVCERGRGRRDRERVCERK
eukprot:3227726-Rhodomonas_salina.1